MRKGGKDGDRDGLSGLRHPHDVSEQHLINVFAPPYTHTHTATDGLDERSLASKSNRSVSQGHFSSTPIKF